MKYYLRFGDIPTSGLSNIWLRDEIIGQELGVSVYDAVLMIDGWHVVLPKPMTHKVINTLYILVAEKRPVYILSGEEIGIGVDGEPLLKDPQILSEITEDFFHKKNYE